MIFSGQSPAATALVDGVVHYYAQGGYYYAGPEETCTAGSGVPAAASPVSGNEPSSTCTAGQFYAVVNGAGKCFNEAGQATVTKPEITSEATTTNATASNPDGSTTVTTNTTINGNTTTTVSTYAPGASVPSLPTSTTTTGDAGSSSAAGTDPVTGKVKDSTADYCAKNPDALMCQSGSGGALSSGAPPVADSNAFYMRQFPDGIAGVWATRKPQLEASPLFSVVTTVFSPSIADGTVPTWTLGMDTGVADFGTVDLTVSSYVWLFIKVCILITALFTARRLIFGG